MNVEKQVDKIICFNDPFNSTAQFMKHNPFFLMEELSKSNYMINFTLLD